MKNFTNNFKQITSRLSARWLIMALMLLMGTSSAWGKTLYIYSTNSNSYAWIWNKSNNNNFTGGSWPGAKLNNTTYFTSLGNNWYKFKTDITVEYGLILSGGASNGQTGDIFINDAVYCIKHNGGNSYENYGPPSGYNIAGSFTDWANSAKNFSSFSDNKQAYSMAAIELGSGTHKLKIRKGSTWYGSSSDNSRGNLKFDSKDGEGNITFTLSTAKKVTFYFDPAADKAFADAVDACSAPTSVSISRGDNSTANICEGNTVNLTATVDGSGDITYKWEKLSGTDWSVFANSTSQTCTVTAGTGEAEFKITATRCSTSKTSTIKLTADTKSALSLTNKTICDGTTINLGDDCIASNTGTVTWYSNSGLTTVVSNLDVTPHTNPTYYYAVAKNGVCANSATQTLTITVDPQPAIELSETEISICNGETVAFTDHIENYEGTVTWYKDEAMSQAVGSVTAKPTATTTYYAKVVSGVCTNYETASLKVTVNDKPAKPTLTADNASLVAPNMATLTVGNTTNGLTYTLYNGTNEVASKTSTGSNLTFEVGDAGSYTVKVANDCGTSTSSPIEISVCTPIQTATLYFANSSYEKLVECPTYCAGDKAYFVLEFEGDRTGDKKWEYNKTNFASLTGTEYNYSFTINDAGTIKVSIPTCSGSVTTNTLTYPAEKVILPPATPKLTSTAITACNSECTAMGYITITNMADYNDGTYTFKLGSSDVTPDADGNLGINSTAYTQYTVKVTNSCGKTASNTVDIAINDKTPTISGKTITQPGKDNAIELTLPTGISANWFVEPNNADLSVNVGNSTLFSAEEENDYVITANNDGCIDTHNVKVSTAFLIWVRRPMSGHASYENIYSGTSEKGGALYLEQTTSGQTYTSVDNVANRNSFTHNKIEPESSYTDCEGATWDIFRTTPEMALAGAKFYVAAKNDVKTNGYATYTKDYTFANGMTADAYFTIGGHASGNKGSEIVLSEQPLPTNVYSSGDAKFNANNFADFVPLYVVDCSGNEVDFYQWQFSATIDGAYTNYSSECSYVGKNTETTDAGKSNNIRVKEDGYYRCIVTYKDGKGTSTSNSIKVTNTTSGTPGTLSFTSELPIIMVNTNDLGFPVNNFGGTPSKNADKMKEKMSVDVKIYEGSTLKYDRKARMNYRGSSSLNFLKKSYAFCPGKADCVEDKGRKDYVKTEKLNMLGIGEAVDKDWVLYAAAADPSLMRNRLMFDTFADMTGGWSVQSRYVELIVDGEYKGVYVMMDKITVNEKRVNIEWKLDKSGNTTQEAFIVKFDKTDVADRYEITSGDQKTFKSKYSGHDGFDTYDTNIDQRFEVEYPEKEDIEDGKGKWSEVFNAIENKINKFEEELAKGNFSEVQKLIDYTSWADWFIITEFAKNIDGYRASNIFVYDGSKANAKIEARPLWDQELSFNNQCPSYYDSYGSSNTSGLLIDKNNSAVYDNDASAPFWFTGKYKGDRGKYNGSGQTFKGLLDDPCFQAEVQARWAIHTGAGGALTSDKMVNMMKGYLADLDKDHVLNSSTIHAGTPLDREFNTFWKNKSRATIDCGTGSGCYAGSTGYTDTGFHNSKVSLNNWLTGSRRTNLGNIINEWEGTELNITLTITPATGITTPWEAVMVQVNNPSGYDYDLEYTTNTLDKVSGVIINENNDKYTYRIPRPEAWKPGDEEKDGERTDIQYGIKATLKVGEGMAQCGNSSQAPSATTTITLQDEANENCPK